MSSWRRPLIQEASNEEDASRDETLNTRNLDQSDEHQDINRNENGSFSNSPIKYTSQFAALLIVVNVTVGAGLLAMPYAMQTSGLVTSILVQAVFLISTVTTCIICTELTAKTNADSFHQLMRVHCNQYIYQFTQIAILLMVFGITVAFIVIVGDQADRVFASLYGPTFCYTWYMNRRFIMSAVTVFLMKPLCAAKTVDFLKYGSFLGLASLGFVMYVVASEFIKQGHVANDVNYLPKNWTDVGSILPVFCLGYQCHLSWVPTAATIRKEEKYRSYVTVTIAMIISTLIYITVSVLAQLTFGSAINKDLTESYPGKSWPILTTIGIIAFKCVVTLPPAFLPLRLSLTDILSGQFQVFNHLSEPVKRYSVTYLTLTVALLLGLFVPDILVAVDILGCLAVLFVFSLPALAYLNLIKENRLMKQQLAGVSGDAPLYSLKDKFKRAISFFFIIFGIIMTILVLYKSIQAIFEKTPSVPLCFKKAQQNPLMTSGAWYRTRNSTTF